MAALEIGRNDGDKDIQHSASNGSDTNSIGASSGVRAISFCANRYIATVEHCHPRRLPVRAPGVLLAGRSANGASGDGEFSNLC